MKLVAKHTSSAEIKNEYNFTFRSPCAFMTCAGTVLSVTFELTHGFSHSVLWTTWQVCEFVEAPLMSPSRCQSVNLSQLLYLACYFHTLKMEAQCFREVWYPLIRLYSILTQKTIIWICRCVKILLLYNAIQKHGDHAKSAFKFQFHLPLQTCDI